MNADDGLKMAAAQAKTDQAWASVRTCLNSLVLIASVPGSESDTLRLLTTAFSDVPSDRLGAILALAVLRLSKVGEQ